jgi:hypothetical protein
MKEESKILITPEGHKIKFRESESVEISLNISTDLMELLEKVAKKRDLSAISIIKFFISKGLRDLEPELTKKTAIERLKSRKVSNMDVEVDLAA